MLHLMPSAAFLGATLQLSADEARWLARAAGLARRFHQRRAGFPARRRAGPMPALPEEEPGRRFDLDRAAEQAV